MRKVVTALCIVMVMAACAFSEPVKLPAPDKNCTMTLTEALTFRRSDRVFSDEDLTIQELSNLLWAAGGVNRPDGKLVYPVAMGIQDITIYVFSREGVFKYNPHSNSIELVAEGDHRKETGMQDFVGKAAVNLVYVHDLGMWKDNKAPEEDVRRCGFAHAGEIVQNVYLYSAAMGWNCVVRMSFDADKLAKLMKLSDTQSITLIQTVGKRPQD